MLYIPGAILRVVVLSTDIPGIAIAVAVGLAIVKTGRTATFALKVMLVSPVT
jgi:hypothetical protein